jgi:hypothetical protein
MLSGPPEIHSCGRSWGPAAVSFDQGAIDNHVVVAGGLGCQQGRVQAGGLCGQHVEGLVQVVVTRGATDLVVGGQLRDAGAVQQPTDHHDGVVEAAQHTGTSAGTPLAPLGVQQ